MVQLNEGQCGLCAHFGELGDERRLVQVRVAKEAPEDLLEDCGHPTHAPLGLRVSAASGCDGFTPAGSA